MGNLLDTLELRVFSGSVQVAHSLYSCSGGYHVYQDVWRAAVGEDLACDRETSNDGDR